MKIIDLKPLISIIIPAFNSGKWIEKCLNSVISQTYQNFECIVLDDGSTDGCGQIIDNYSKKDCRIRVIHKQNEGLSATRNRGLKEAKGEWISIIDSDDWMDSNFIEGFLSADSEAELVIQSIEDYLKDKPHCDITYHFEDRMWKDEEIGYLYSDPMMMKYGTTWSRLYRKDIIEKFNLAFEPSFSSMEDVLFSHQYLSKCNKIYTVSYYGYHYIYHPSSLAHTNNMTFRNKHDVSEAVYKACLLNPNLTGNKKCVDLIKDIYIGSCFTSIRGMYANKLTKDDRIKYINEIKTKINYYGLRGSLIRNSKTSLLLLPSTLFDYINLIK